MNEELDSRLRDIKDRGQHPQVDGDALRTVMVELGVLAEALLEVREEVGEAGKADYAEHFEQSMEGFVNEVKRNS